MRKAPNIKYPNTRALVIHAIGQGLTQKKIAKLCNVQQSVVSDWNTGKKEARRGVIEPLLKKFGDVVNSSDFRVYHVFSDIKYQINEAVINHLEHYVRRLKKNIKKDELEKDRYHKEFPNEKKNNFVFWLKQELIKNIEAALQSFHINQSKVYQKEEDFLKFLECIDDIQRHKSFFELDWLRRELLTKSMVYKSEIVQVEGPVIFEYKFQFANKEYTSRWDRGEKLVTWMKWIIHDNGEEKHTWIVQRDRYKNTNLVTEASESEERWISIIEEPNELEAILERARSYPFTEDEKKLINKDGVIFMLTKAFIERGYPVQGIRIIEAKKG